MIFWSVHAVHRFRPRAPQLSIHPATAPWAGHGSLAAAAQSPREIKTLENKQMNKKGFFWLLFLEKRASSPRERRAAAALRSARRKFDQFTPTQVSPRCRLSREVNAPFNSKFNFILFNFIEFIRIPRKFGKTGRWGLQPPTSRSSTSPLQTLSTYRRRLKHNH